MAAPVPRIPVSSTRPGRSWPWSRRGAGNRFGHPKPQVVRRWCDAGAEVLDTARSGAVRIWLGRNGLQTDEAPRQPAAVVGCRAAAACGGWAMLRTGVVTAMKAGGLTRAGTDRAGGWPMIPLLLLSAVALAIIVERFWSLRRDRVLPPGLGDEVRAGWRAATAGSFARRFAAFDRAAGRIVGRRAGRAQPQPRGNPRTRRGRGPPPRAPDGTLPQYAGHHRRGRPAAGPVRHRGRHDRDVPRHPSTTASAMPTSSPAASARRWCAPPPACWWRSRRWCSIAISAGASPATSSTWSTRRSG